MAGLHPAKLVVQPRLVGIVDDALVQQDTGKLGEEVFKVPEVVCFNRLNFSLKPVKTFFEGTIQHGLLEAVFDKIHPVAAKTDDKDDHRHYGDSQKERHCYRRKSIHYVIQNIPTGHGYNIIGLLGLGQEPCFSSFRGRPPLETSRIASKVDFGKTACRVRGFIPARFMRKYAASSEIPSISANSCNV